METEGMNLLSYWSSLRSSDILTALYFIFIIFIVILSNHFFIAFVNSKPEGRKTVLGVSITFSNNHSPLLLSAKLSIAISRSAMVGTILAYSPVVLRIIFGPFNSSLAVGVFYLHHLIFTFIMNLLTFKTIIASAFLVDFARMSGVKLLKTKIKVICRVF